MAMSKPHQSPVILDPDVLRSLGELDTPTISNAIEQFRVRDRLEGYSSCMLRCMFPELPAMVGYAVTCTAESAPPSDPHLAGWGPLLDVIRDAPKPVVVVVGWSGGDSDRGCVIGDIVATSLAQLGVVGIVTETSIRDRAGIRHRAPEMQVFARGLVASHGRTQLARVGEPTLVAGLLIEAGALVHGDESGLITIPREVAADAIDVARKIQISEEGYVDAVTRSDVSFAHVRKRLAPHE